MSSPELPSESEVISNDQETDIVCPNCGHHLARAALKATEKHHRLTKIDELDDAIAKALGF